MNGEGPQRKFESIEDLKVLTDKSQWLRKELFEMVIKDTIGHFPSSSSIAEVVLSLYYGGILNHNPKDPEWEDRDRLIVSKGHAGMVLYPILADLGYFPKDEIQKFAQSDGILRFYPDKSIPGIETIGGSLGHGLALSIGSALVAKKDGKDYRNFVVVSDGECYEGSTWEAAMYASDQGLENLVAVLDKNKCIILGDTDDLVNQEPLEEKWKAFGWHTYNVDGHSYSDLLGAFDHALERKDGKPSVIISNSVKGKGISFMENKSSWHNKMPDDQQREQARYELDRINPIYS